MGARGAPHEKQRNGHREQDWDTHAGRIELAIPERREVSYFTRFLEPICTTEKTLLVMI